MMAVICREVTKADLDNFYALEEIDKVAHYLFRGYEGFIDQHRGMAIDEQTGYYIINLPQGDRMDAADRYVLVCDGKIILSDGVGGTSFSVEYISPSLIPRLDELTLFMRKAFVECGEGFLKIYFTPELAAQRTFIFSNKTGA